jgi:xanthine/uracil permease
MVALALSCGGSILLFLDQIPSGVLGVMLVISGHSLALTGWTMLIHETPPDKLQQEAGVALLTLISIVGLKKTHYGSAVGLVAHLVYGDGLALLRGTSSPPLAR